MSDNLPALNAEREVSVAFDGAASFRASTNAATLCAAIVKQTAKPIQGKRYVAVEGWQAIVIAHGCTASAHSVEKIEGGFRAIGEVRRMNDGQLIAQAEGFLGDDEGMWAKRPVFARRAMAQTRAISRACRSAFAHVVVMIDADLGTTPAEEMEAVVDQAPREKLTSTGETRTKMPEWSSEQKQEIGVIFKEIYDIGGKNGEEEVRLFRNKHKYDDPSSTLDAAALLHRRWLDIQDQANTTKEG